jgi:hypothetical protein
MEWELDGLFLYEFTNEIRIMLINVVCTGKYVCNACACIRVCACLGYMLFSYILNLKLLTSEYQPLMQSLKYWYCDQQLWQFHEYECE